MKPYTNQEFADIVDECAAEEAILNPCPKEKPIRLSGKAKQKFRLAVCKRAGSRCETCGAFAPLSLYGTFDLIYCGHVHHVKSRGAGGEDVLSEDVVWLCYNCHQNTHGPRWSGGK